MAFICYTERPRSALCLAGEAGARLMCGFQLSDATASSHTMVTEFLGCPSKSWPPYPSPTNFLGAFLLGQSQFWQYFHEFQPGVFFLATSYLGRLKPLEP